MKHIDTGYDTICKSNYDLFQLSFSELRDLARTWYPPNTDFAYFDRRTTEYDIKNNKNDNVYKQMKITGVLSNYIFAYKEDGQYYLMDGFNRLFTDYGELEFDTPVYLKVFTDKLEPHKLMYIMFMLNMWKMKP